MGLAGIFLFAVALFDQRWETPPLMVTGRAVDAAGKPIPALKIELADFEPGEQWLERPSVVTGDDGRFKLGPLDRIGYATIVSGRLSDGTTLLWSHTIRRRENGVDNVGDLIVEHTDPWVKGRVVDVDGKPVSGAEVVAFNHACRVFAKSDADGRFAIGGIFAFDVRVDARTDKLQMSTVTSALDDRGRPIAMELKLDTPRELHPKPDPGLPPSVIGLTEPRDSKPAKPIEHGGWIEGFVSENRKRMTNIDGYRREMYVEIGSDATQGIIPAFVEFDGSFRAGPLPLGIYRTGLQDSKPLFNVDVFRGGKRIASGEESFTRYLAVADGEKVRLELSIVR